MDVALRISGLWAQQEFLAISRCQHGEFQEGLHDLIAYSCLDILAPKHLLGLVWARAVP